MVEIEFAGMPNRLHFLEINFLFLCVQQHTTHLGLDITKIHLIVTLAYSSCFASLPTVCFVLESQCSLFWATHTYQNGSIMDAHQAMNVPHSLLLFRPSHHFPTAEGAILLSLDKSTHVSAM